MSAPAEKDLAARSPVGGADAAPPPPLAPLAPPVPTGNPAVERARRAWVGRLMDLSQRNNLLYYRPLKVGTLDLTHADRELLADLLGGRRAVPLRKLLPPDADRTQAEAQLKQIARKAKENFEERGLETLHLAAGMATWEGEAGKRPPEAAVLLVPLTLELKARGGPALARGGEPEVNPVFLHVLANQYGCAIDPVELLKAAHPAPEPEAERPGEARGGTGAGRVADDDEDEEEDELAFDLDAVLARLVDLAGDVPKFGVRRRVALGNFSFQKMAMVRDLEELGPELAASDIIAGLAGDVAARARIAPAGGVADGDPDPREFDRQPPEAEHLVLDTDSSQQRAIRLGQRGQSLVIQGPPGTGKSQVITNLIVQLAAEGKRVLFVAEKRAALQVVLDRLHDRGLGHLALDLHGAETSRKLIAGRLRDGLANVDRGEPVASDAILKPFASRRAALNAHAGRMHAPRPPSGMSVFEMQGRLLRARGEPTPKARFRRDALMALTPDALSRAKDALVEAAALGSLFLGTSPSAWAGAALTDGHAAQAAMDLADRLAEESWPAARVRIAATLRPARATEPATVAEGIELLRTAVEANRVLATFRADLFKENLHDLAAALQPAAGGLFARLWATMTNARYRRAKAIVEANSTSQLLPADLPRVVKDAAAVADRWRAAGFDRPAPVEVPGAAETLKEAEVLAGELGKLGQAVNRGDLTRMPAGELTTLLAALSADDATPRRVPALRRIATLLSGLGLDPLVAELRQSHADAPDAWPGLLERAWLRSCLEHAWADDPDLASFDGRVHGKAVAEFCRLDRERLDLAARTVARAHVRTVVDALRAAPQQAALVRREAEKKMRHLPFRRLLAQAPDVLGALFPCFMCSPLSVSQLLPGDRRLFDVVVFDEASQVLPEDAVAALVRGRQAIVAGDEHQLAPTEFFASGADDDEDDGTAGDATADAGAGATEGFESLLSMMKSFVPAPMLEWHYRSRDERLIAFSNRHVYGDRLITFPGPGGDAPAVSHVLVSKGDGPGDGESGSAEVRRVVAMVLDHARAQLDVPPERRKSLGVIAMSLRHAQRVEAALDRALEDHEDLEPFFDPNASDRFFVKNLERVQGDERHVIYLTMGVEPDASGRVSLTHFGPVNSREKGYRRLNVAITRAKERMVIVSAFGHHAINAGNNPSRGIDLLRQYLHYASTGGRHLGDGQGSGVPLNAFEADVADALAAAGIETVPQWGTSRYRIDLVARHPRRPGRVVLAIECDGATYHSAPTARDRDRLRQQHLEALGWRFHRIWSTDWFTRRDDELRRARQAFDDAFAYADATDAAAAPPGGRDEHDDGFDGAASVEDTAAPDVDAAAAAGDEADGGASSSSSSSPEPGGAPA
jgi:very-short-patch-repair endonuclease